MNQLNYTTTSSEMFDLKVYLLLLSFTIGLLQNSTCEREGLSSPWKHIAHLFSNHASRVHSGTTLSSRMSIPPILHGHLRQRSQGPLMIVSRPRLTDEHVPSFLKRYFVQAHVLRALRQGSHSHGSVPPASNNKSQPKSKDVSKRKKKRRNKQQVYPDKYNTQPADVQAQKYEFDQLVKDEIKPHDRVRVGSKITVEIIPEIYPEVDSESKRSFLHGASRFGLPSNDNLKLCDNFILSYDRRLRHPIWVLEHLTYKQMWNRVAVRKLSLFHPDETIHEYFRSTNEDYIGSEYDRGHMSPASDNMADQRWMDQSFCLSNVAPQLPGLNRGPWRLLENYVDHLTRKSKNVYVVTGSLYVSEKINRSRGVVTYNVIGKNEVGVPNYFYKVWVREDRSGKLSMEAFKLPNTDEVDVNTLLAKFRLNIDRDLPVIERATGLIFFDKLNRTQVAKPDTFQMKFNEKLKRSTSIGAQAP